MDAGFILRLFSVLIVMVLVAFGLLAVERGLSPSSIFIRITTSDEFASYAKQTVEQLSRIILLSLIIMNWHAIWRFLRRTITPTDAQILGRWYVSRYQKKNNDWQISTDEWRIDRSATSEYRVKMLPTLHPVRLMGWNYSGRVLYVQRDRFNVELNGANHAQQSLICFQLNIDEPNDSRILGIGVGDDNQYVLSTRIYFASRQPFSEEYVRKIIDDTTARLRNANPQCPLLQLPVGLISEVLSNYDPPVAEGDDIQGLARISLSEWWYFLVSERLAKWKNRIANLAQNAVSRKA